jgi:hypothetical protein
MIFCNSICSGVPGRVLHLISLVLYKRGAKRKYGQKKTLFFRKSAFFGECRVEDRSGGGFTDKLLREF